MVDKALKITYVSPRSLLLYILVTEGRKVYKIYDENRHEFISYVKAKVITLYEVYFFYLFIFINFYLFIFGCIGSSLCCRQAFSLVVERGSSLLVERGLLFIAVRRLLIAVASLVVERGL